MPIIFLLFLLSCTSLVSCNKDDEIALLKIKQQLGDPDILSSWIEGFDFCNALYPSHWFILCTSTGRVSSFRLYILNVTAPFPDAICNLTEQEGLLLYHIPGLYGPIPSCITTLFKLNDLTIMETSLSGSMPNFLYHTNIAKINLRSNHLSGTIPPSLSTLPNLNTLALSSNYLTGTIPSFLSALPKLDFLDLSSNYLTGTIPYGLFHGPFHGSSAILILSNNNLTGEVPRCYGLVTFKVINLGNNKFRGDASFLFAKQKMTNYIGLDNNEFEFDLSYVEIPEYLFTLALSHNKIYGKIPDSINSAVSLSELDLSFNSLCGEIPRGGNMWKFNAMSFANNTCLCGYPLPPCSASAPSSVPL